MLPNTTHTTLPPQSDSESEPNLAAEEAKERSQSAKWKRKNSYSCSDGEIKDEDALSITCSDDEYFKDIDAELDDREHTVDAVADSLAVVVDKSFKKKCSDKKLKAKFNAIKNPENC